MIIRLEDIVNESIENVNKIMIFLDREVSNKKNSYLKSMVIQKKEKLDLSKGLVNQNFSNATNVFIKYIAEYLK